MSDLGFVDVNCHVGPTTGPSAGSDPNILREQHRSAGVSIGLARHLSSEHAEAARWNRFVADLAAQPLSGLLAVATMSASGVDPDAEISETVPAECVAVWIKVPSPAIRAEADRRLLRAAARTGKPLLVPIASWGDATAVAEMTSGLGVRVVLVGAHYTHFVDDLAAAELHEHVLLETSALAHYGAIETAVARIGAERLLLGTDLPRRCSRSAVNSVLSARISNEAKRKILGENAQRVFGLPHQEVQLPPPVTAQRAVDVHCHFGVSGWPVAPVADDRLDSELAHYGVESFVASSLLAIVSDLEAGNEAMARACAAPNRLGYVVADPNDLDATRWALRRHSGRDVIGVKVHCQYSRQPTSSRAIWDLFELLGKDGRPVKIHNDGPGWDEALVRIARAREGLPIIIAHAGLGAPSLEAAKIAASCDNVYLELSSSFAERATVAKLVEIAGTDRLLFGSDAPLLNPAYVLGSYLDAGIPADRWEAVCRDNARSLFHLN
jgi:predicted TIM-barrel fold metal-dependent hydrolase